MGDLGCGAAWSWQVRTREGVLVCEPSPADRGWRLEVERRLDDTGSATLTLDAGCCDCVDTVETGDELWCWREGALAFLGPVVKATRQAPFGEAVLESKDRSWWLTGRTFGFPVDWTSRDAGLNLADLLAANAAVDPMVALEWVDPPAGNLLGVDLSMQPNVATTFWSALDTLGQSVIDWTVLGAGILVGLEGTPTPDLPLLDATSWDDGRFTTVTDHGDYADQVIVEGAAGVLGYWPPLVATPPFRPAPHPRWGGRVAYIADAILADVYACITRAQAEYRLRYPPPRRLSVPDGALIDPAVSWGLLVPGASAIVAAPSTCDETTLVPMLLATVKAESEAGIEQSVTAALVEKGATLAAT